MSELKSSKDGVGPLGWTLKQFVYDGLRTCRQQIAVKVGEDREGWVKDEWYWLELQKLVRSSSETGCVRSDIEAWFNETCRGCKCEGLIGDCPTSLRAKIREMLSVETDEGFQARVYDWMARCFARPDAMQPAQRSFRFIEEALELVQASGTSREEVLRLVEYVYSRPAGVIDQEIGGVMVTLSGLATSFGLSMEHAGDAELARCEENTERIRSKDLAKPQRSPLPGPTELKASEGPASCTCDENDMYCPHTSGKSE